MSPTIPPAFNLPIWKLYFWTFVSCKHWEYQLHWQLAAPWIGREAVSFRHGNSAEFLWSGIWELAWICNESCPCLIQTYQIRATKHHWIITILVWHSFNFVLVNLMRHQFFDILCWKKHRHVSLWTKLCLFFTIFTFLCMFCLGISVAQWVRSIFDVFGMVYTVRSSENVNSQ